MEPRGFTQGAVGRNQQAVPCPTCYRECTPTAKGWACPTHGVLLKQPKAKR